MKIKKIREQRGLSQQAVAKQLSLTRTTYTKYENGVHDPSLATLVKMAQFFALPLDYIVGSGVCTCPGVGGRLRSRREDAGVTAEDAALLLNIPVELYEDFESGLAEPTLDMLRRLARACHTTADDLLGLEDEPEEVRPVPQARDPGRTARQADIYERIRGAFMSGGGAEDDD